MSKKYTFLQSFSRSVLVVFFICSLVIPSVSYGAGGPGGSSVLKIDVTDDGGLANGFANCTTSGMKAFIGMPDTGSNRATADLLINNAGEIYNFAITNPGSGYTTVPTVLIDKVSLIGVCSKTPLAKATIAGGVVTGLEIIGSCKPTNDPTAPTTVTIDNAPLGPGFSNAYAVPTVVDGLITQITVTIPGTGYATAPLVTINSPYCQHPPKAVATLSSSSGGGTKPVLTEVHPVPTPTTSTSPYYTFKSSETGTIKYGGACDSATKTVDYANVSTSVTFKKPLTTNTPLSIGTYTDCTITVTGATSKLDSLPLDVPDFTIGALEEVTPVVSPSSTTTPSYTFKSTTGGIIAFPDACKSSTTTAVAGNNIIKFTPLTPGGTYGTCTMYVTSNGVKSNTLNIKPFTVASSATPDSGSGSGSSLGSGSNGSNSYSNTEGIKNPLGDKFLDLSSFVYAMLDIVLMIGVPLIVLAIIYCGFLFVVAQGNSEAIGKAKKALLYTIIGAALLLGCFVLAKAIAGTVVEIQKGV